MKESNYRVIVSILATVLGLCGLSLLSTRSGPAPVQAACYHQAKPHKYVGKDLTFPFEPIELAELRIKGKPARLNNKVYENDDWLDGLRIRVRNISNRAIKSITLYLTFPDLPPRPLSLPLTWASNSQQAGGDLRQVHPLGPHESVIFSVEGKRYSQLRALLESRAPLAEVQRLNIEFQMVIFEDDSAWSEGKALRRDPSNPTQWIEIK